MKLELKVFDCLCELRVFKINGICAHYSDFGDKEDMNTENAEDYACGDMQFIPKECSDKVLEKYSITKEEYDTVCNKLDILSFGCCQWCV